MKKLSHAVLALVFALGTLMFISTSPTNEVSAEFDERVFMSSDNMEARGGDPVTYFTERIDFHRREFSTFSLNPTIPAHLSLYHCGVTGAAAKISWYHVQHPSLKPGHNPGMHFGNQFFWGPPSPVTRAMHSELNVRMGGGAGVTIDQYIMGIGGFLRSRDFRVSVGQVRAGNNSVSPSFFTSMHNGIPVALFLDGFNLLSPTSIQSNNGFDIVSLVEHRGLHIMAAYGYLTLSYFNANNVMFRQDVYLHVNTGFAGMPRGLIRISSHSTLVSAITTHIS